MALDEPPKAFSIHILFSLENKISQPNMATLRHNVMETGQGHNLGTQKNRLAEEAKPVSFSVPLNWYWSFSLLVLQYH